MSNSRQFLQHFIKDHISFFTRPLPRDENVYNMEYSLAKLDWKALRQGINLYRPQQEMMQQLQKLFVAVEAFNFSLKTSGSGYVHATNALKKEWNEIQALVKGVRL